MTILRLPSIITFISFCFSAHAQYTLTDDDVVVENGVLKAYTGSETDIAIPNTLDGEQVTSIDAWAFASNSLTNVDLSAMSSLNSIGYGAFHNNYITSVDLTGLSELHTIDEKAFEDNLLSSLDFTGLISLNTIGDDAFYNNSISSLDFAPLTNLVEIQNAAFSHNSIVSVNFSGLTQLTSIGRFVFAGNPLTEFALPTPGISGGYWRDDEGLTHDTGETVSDLDSYYYYTILDEYTLQDDDLLVEDGEIVSVDLKIVYPNIVVPNVLDGQTITSIGDYAFANKFFVLVNLTAMADLHTIGYHSFSANSIDNLNITGLSNLAVIGEYAFSANSISDIDFTGLTNLTTIESHAFKSNSLISLDFSSLGSLTRIGSFAFSNNSLSTINFNGAAKLNSISYAAFSDNSISSIDMGSLGELTVIEAHAFSDNLLSEFSLPTPIFSGGHWLDDEDAIQEPGEIVSALDTYYNYIILDDYLIQDSDVAVEGGEIISVNLKLIYPNIIIPNVLDGQEITSIGDWSFYNNSFASIDLTALDNLTSIGFSAFANNYLTSFDFSGSSNLSSIGNSAFYGNVLVSIDLSGMPNLVTVEPNAFANNSLTEFVLPVPEERKGYTSFWKDSYGTTLEHSQLVTDLNLRYEMIRDLIHYDITYDLDNGTHTNPVSFTIVDEVILASDTKEGYTFNGWFLESDFVTQITEIPVGSTGDIELYAKFTEIPLSVDADSGAYLSLYPNPVESSFQISGLTTSTSIEIYSMNGNLLKTVMDVNGAYDVGDLQSGIYVARFQLGYNVKTLRIVKQ
jgi:uncharacterized repeat protein (TIGR02543 family)